MKRKLKDADDTMDRVCKQGGSLERNGQKEDTSNQNQKEMVKFLGYLLRKERLENLTLTMHIEGKLGHGE